MGPDDILPDNICLNRVNDVQQVVLFTEYIYDRSLILGISDGHEIY